MQIAFLILSHRGSDQLRRLVRALRAELPAAPIVVHHDKFRSAVDVGELMAEGATGVLTADHPITWGDFSLVDATLRSMAWMIERVDFDWLVVLSGQDYPVRSLSTLEQHLANSGADVLIDAMAVAEIANSRERLNKQRRYFYQYSSLGRGQLKREESGKLRPALRSRTKLLMDVANNLLPFVYVYKFSDQLPWRLGFRARRTPFSPQFACWYGSNWYSLSRPATELLVSSARDHPEYVEYYRRTAHPDESAIATLLCNARELTVVRESLHHVRWTRPQSGHPDIFVEADLPELLESGKYFARKFDADVDVKILDQLDIQLQKGSDRVSTALEDKGVT